MKMSFTQKHGRLLWVWPGIVLHCTLYCRYRCEVSTEAPMFSTESKYGDLLVIVLPSRPPQVPHTTSTQILACGVVLLGARV